MKRLLWWHSTIALLALSALAGCGNRSAPLVNTQDDKDSAASEESPNAQNLVDLQNLRDVGILSPAEYEAKLAAVAMRPDTGRAYGAAPKEFPSVSLRHLQDRGLLTENEYQQFVPKAYALEGENADSNGNVVIDNDKVLTRRDAGDAGRNELVKVANNSVRPGAGAAAPGGNAPATSESDAPRQGANGRSTFSGNMQNAEIGDPVYQMLAGTLLIPGGWKFAGQVVRPTGCHAGGTIMQFSAQSADGLFAVEQMPGIAWVWTSNPQRARTMQQQGCPAVSVASAADFLQYMVLPDLRPNAQIISMDDGPPGAREKVAAQEQQMRQENVAMAQQYRQQAPALTHAGKRARIRYEIGGQPVEEYVGAIVTCTERHFAGNMVAPPTVRRDCYSGPLFTYRAPAGQLESFFQQAMDTFHLTVDRQWSSRLASAQRAAFQQAQAVSNANFNAMMNQGAVDQQMRTQAWIQGENLRTGQVNAALAQQKIETDGRQVAAQNVVHATLGQGVFVNPQTGQRIVLDSNQFQFYYRAPNGSYYGTNNPRDPNTDPAMMQGTYTPLQRTQ